MTPLPMMNMNPLALFALLIMGTASAQPTIDQGNFATVIGGSFVVNASAWMDPGASGADVTWDFSGLVIDSTFTDTYEDPAETPDGTSFPTATLALPEGGGYSYLSFDATGGYFLGVSLAGQAVIAYMDPELIFQFPCSNGTQWIDDFHAEFTTAGFDIVRDGTLIGEADGYGTLVLPSGTFDNVLRVHLTRTYSDLGPIQIDYVDDFYYYLRPGTHFPLVEVYSNSVNFFGSPTVTTGVDWLNDPTTAVPDADAPATTLCAVALSDGLVRVDLSLAEGGLATLEVIDAAGRTAMQDRVGVSAGRSSNTFAIPSLAHGLYSLRVLLNGQQMTARLFVP